MGGQRPVDPAGAPREQPGPFSAFGIMYRAAKLPAAEWTPRELRHSFVSLLSDGGMPIKQISRLAGHSGTTVTEFVYRKQIRPVEEDGATAMNRIFPGLST